MLPNLCVMHHVMSVLLLAAGCLCVGVCRTSFFQLPVCACLLFSVFLLPSGSSFQDGSMGFLAEPSFSPSSSYWETMGGLLQGYRSVYVCGDGEGFIGGVVGFPSGNCRFIPAAERPSCVSGCLLVFQCVI